MNFLVRFRAPIADAIFFDVSCLFLVCYGPEHKWFESDFKTIIAINSHNL